MSMIRSSQLVSIVIDDGPSNTTDACEDDAAETLPFAVENSDSQAQTTKAQHLSQSGGTVEKEKLDNPNAWSTLSTETMKTTPDSSIYSQSPEKSHLGFNGASSSMNGGHDIEFETAASLVASSSSLFASSWMNERREPYEKVDQATVGRGSGSLDFSQLMHQADDRNTIAKSTKQLPTLKEEEETRPGDAFGETRHSSLSPSQAGNESWLPAESTSASSPLSRVREIQVEVQSEFSFRLSMEFNSNCSRRDVMSVIANPDVLRLWNESVASLVVTRSSEGAYCGLNRHERRDQDRQYDGEWIEATASLNSPVNGIGLLHSASNYVRHSLGFPSTSKVTMFVERERGNIGLTIGPFDGGLHVFHNLSVSEYQGAVRLEDCVKLSFDGLEEPSSASVDCCGLWSVVQKCMWRPQAQQQMDQCVASLQNLRLMVQSGEHRKYDDVGGLTIVGANEEDPTHPLLT